MKKTLQIWAFVFCTQMLQAQIVNIESSRLNETKEGWQGLLDLNLYAIKNTNTFYQLNNKTRLQYTKERNRLLLINDLNLSITNLLNVEQNAFQHVRYGFMLDSPIVVECFYQNQYDKIQLIKRRMLWASGLRFQFIKKDLIDAFFGFSYMFEYERELKTLDFYFNSRLNSYLNLKLSVGKGIKFYTTTYYQPLFIKSTDFRINTVNTFEFKVNQSLSLTSSFYLNYDSNPVDDPSVQKQILKLTNGFSYKLL